jgi:hypothetical protein
METSSAFEEASATADCGDAESDEVELFAGEGGGAPKDRKENPLSRIDKKPLNRTKDLVRREFMAQTSTDRWRS